MCGIFGIIGSIPQALAWQCVSTLRHRGPDGSGLWCDDMVTLGHRRLSILDLSENGSQPMTYGEGRFRITFNGEIYNFVEIRAELERIGHRFRTDTDTEVVLAAYTQWGEACLDRFNGMWAFAIWDGRERSLFLSRDRLGKKPLFYTFLPGRKLAFASEMKALFPLIGEVRPDVGLVRDLSRVFRYESTEECVIQGIRRFPAGHLGIYRDGDLSLRRWWCTLDHIPEMPARYEEQVEHFRDLFVDACRLRMRSDVPIGTALSGGLDSSAVIACMARSALLGKTERMYKRWQHAFVASFTGTPLDESVYARKVADHLGVELTAIEIDPVQGIENLERYLYLIEDLYITSPIPFMQTYEAVKSNGISVTLDGHGGDELFGGYSFDYLVAIRDAGWDIRGALEVVDTYYDSWPQGSQQFKSLRWKPLFLAKRYVRETARKIVGARKWSAHVKDADHPGWEEMDHLGRQLYESTHTTVLPTLLRNYDRYSMASGVEIRMPFLDHRIVTYAFSLPWYSKIRGGYAKAIIRDAVTPLLPPEVVYRKSKIGFNSPIVDWMKNPLRSYLLDLIGSQSFRECTLIDSKSVAKEILSVIENPKARFSDGERAWTLLTPYLWERAVIKGAGA